MRGNVDDDDGDDKHDPISSSSPSYLVLSLIFGVYSHYMMAYS